jgi:hypothetical protein
MNANFGSASIRMSENLGNLKGNLGDNIANLPTDGTIPSHNEIQMVETLFKQKHGTIQKLFAGTKEFVLLLILFVVFSVPQIDALFRKFVTSAESPYILAGIKGVVFTVAYFLIKNMYLVRK